MLRATAVLAAAALAVLVVLWSSTNVLPWPRHAAERRDALMVQLGAASASGRGLDALERRARAVSVGTPLDDAPFLVGGGIAEQRGDALRSERLFRAALDRNPRSVGAHFMLARRALAEGDADVALRHLAGMARQTPGAGPEFSSMMLAVAGDRTLDRSLRRFLAQEPKNRDVLFEAMAANPDLTSRLFELAPPVAGGSSPRWLGAMVATELNANRHDSAALAWTRYGGGADPRLEAVRDRTFSLKGPQPPFGWTVIPSESGAVAAGASGLDIETYGRSSQPLLAQTLLLVPGRYAVQSAATHGVASQLEWRVRCLGAEKAMAALPAAGKSVLAVPPNCPTQSLELWTRDFEEADPASGKLLSIDLERLS